MYYSDYYGIFGGTFDPIHNGHIQLAHNALNEMHLRKIIFMPAYIPPHKHNRLITSDYHRYNMVKAAIKNEAQFDVSSMEFELKGSSYTARTLTLLQETHKKLVFIVGADSFMALDTWYRPDVIFSKSVIACAGRQDVDKERLTKKADEYEQKFSAQCHILDMANIDISSTIIRDSIKHNMDFSSYVPKAVYDYITQHNLYM